MELFQRLIHCQTIRFYAWSDLDLWRRQGCGQVLIKQQAKQVTFYETGYWLNTNAPQKKYLFNNTWVYNFLADKVTLSYLRLGDRQPIVLCNLMAKGKGVFESQAPYYCGQDIYTVLIDISQADLLVVNWMISGRKAESHSRYYY